jgi:hypothetical protein
VVYQYDDEGRQIELAYYDAHGNPTSDGQGIAIYRRDYNDAGLPVTETFHGPDGELITNRLGFAKVSHGYDDDGNEVSLTYLDIDGNPVVPRNREVAQYKRQYNADGQPVEERRFGADGDLKNDKNGMAIVRWKYDSLGNRTEVAYFDAEGNPAEDPESGAAAVRLEYNEAGEVVGTTGFDAEGNVVNPGGQQAPQIRVEPRQK